MHNVFCVPKNIPPSSCYVIHERILIIFGRHVTEKVSSGKWFTFPSYLTGVFALPCKIWKDRAVLISNRFAKNYQNRLINVEVVARWRWDVFL